MVLASVVVGLVAIGKLALAVTTGEVESNWEASDCGTVGRSITASGTLGCLGILPDCPLGTGTTSGRIGRVDGFLDVGSVGVGSVE